MAEPPPRLESTPEPPHDPGARAGDGSKPPAPRWVKVFGIIALVFAVLVVVMLATGGGDHGPGRHSGSGESAGQTTPSGPRESDRKGGHTPPAGGHTP